MIFRNFELTSFNSNGEMTAEVTVLDWRTLWLVGARTRVYKPGRSEPWHFETGEPIKSRAIGDAFRAWWDARSNLGYVGIPVFDNNTSATDADLS